MPFVTDLAFIDAAKLRVSITGIEEVAGTGLVVEGHLRFPRMTALLVGIVLAGGEVHEDAGGGRDDYIASWVFIYFFCCIFLNPCKIFKRKVFINGQKT